MLRELASKRDLRCLPALRIAAAAGPNEEYRSLARALVEKLSASLRADPR